MKLKSIYHIFILNHSNRILEFNFTNINTNKTMAATKPFKKTLVMQIIEKFLKEISTVSNQFTTS